MQERIVKFALKISSLRPKLANKLFKIAVPLVFDASDSNPSEEYRIVYRIQNNKGEGFWHNSKTWLNPQDYNRFQNLETLKGGTLQGYLPLPDPTSDTGFLLSERQSFPGKLFAFESPTQANLFIMPQQWDLLLANGFSLTPVKARKVWSSGVQVYYEPF
jgi:hypothetical protein